MNYNPDKVISAGADNLRICYTDTGKQQWITYSNPKVEDIQLYGSNFKGKVYQDIPSFNLNPTQVRMYRVAVYGIDALSQEEVKHLAFQETLSIAKKQNRAQRLINRWKQQITSTAVQDFLNRKLPNSGIVKRMNEYVDYTTDKDINPFTFRDLGISQEMLVNRLIEWKVLPENFYSLT